MLAIGGDVVRKLSFGVILLIVGVLALSNISPTLAQTGFPIGLQLSYIGDHSIGGQLPSTYSYDYEVISWREELGPNILEARSRNSDFPTWGRFFHSSVTWRLYDNNGDPMSEYVFPRFWIDLSSLEDGGEIEFYFTTGTVSFDVTADNEVTVAAGSYTCWRVYYSGTMSGFSSTFELYYDKLVGVLIRYELVSDWLSGTTYDSSSRLELSDSNFEEYIPLPPLLSGPLLLLAGGGIAVAVVVSAVGVLLWKRRSSPE